MDNVKSKKRANNRRKPQKPAGQKSASNRSRPQQQGGMESIPINPSVLQRVREILRERGFPGYQ